MTQPQSNNRADKVKLLLALKEKQRRIKASRPTYVPNEGQARVHGSNAKVRAVFAGNGGGKTVLAAHEAMWAAEGFNPITKQYTAVPATVIVLLDHPDKVEEPWLSTLRQWFNLDESKLSKNGKPYYNQYDLANGSKIKWMFHQQDPLTFESLECDFVVADEPPPRSIYISLRRGGRKKNRRARFLIIGTPISAAWLRTDLYEPWVKGELQDTECFRYGSAVNEKNLATGYLQEFSAILTEKERRIRLEGEFFDMDGLALAHLLKKNSHIVSRESFKKFWDPARYPCVIAVDPHPSKAHVAIILGAGPDGQIYYIKETQKKMVARDFARHVKEWSAKLRIVDIVIDSLGSADGTGNEGFKSFIQVFNEEMRGGRATTFDEKSDEGLIERFRNLLQVPDKPNNFGQFLPRLQILEGCPGIVRDIENVSFLKYKDLDMQKEKLDMRNTDFLSCLKYGLATGVHYNKGNARAYKPKQKLYGF